MTGPEGSRLTILSAGAAESLVGYLDDPAAELGVPVDASFAAVGVLKDTWLAGTTADLYITSSRVMEELRTEGELEAVQVADLGWVPTGLAVRDGEDPPDATTAEGVFAALRGASAVFTPDPVRSTAGAHFADVLERAGVLPLTDGVLHAHPNGKTAMRALADHDGTGPAVGCTQMTEILQTDGVEPVGVLPPPLDLATLYQCALVSSDDATPTAAARRAFDLLTGPSSAELRARLGFVERPAGA